MTKLLFSDSWGDEDILGSRIAIRQLGPSRYEIEFVQEGFTRDIILNQAFVEEERKVENICTQIGMNIRTITCTFHTSGTSDYSTWYTCP